MRSATVVPTILVLCLLGSGSDLAAEVTFTKDTLIPPDDASYDGQDIIVDGCTVTIDGQHAFNSIQVLHGGVITHSPRFTPAQHLVVEEDVTIDVASKIDASGKGYGPGTGPGRGGVGNNYGGGGGYGGSGGGSDDASGRGALGGVTYGVVEEPVQFGSGGGEGLGQAGGAGAGAIRLTVWGTLTVDGAIAANGTNGTRYFANGGGGGAGGSVYLTVGTLAGAGQIAANGGDGADAPDTRCGGGGGGRVAVHYDKSEYWGVTCAQGGDGFTRGGAGTIFMKGPEDVFGHLIFDSGGHAGRGTSLPLGSYHYDDLIIRKAARVLIDSGVSLTATDIRIREAGELTLNSAGEVDFKRAALSSGGTFLLNRQLTVPTIEIQSGGMLTHSASQSGFNLRITDDMTIQMGGMLSVDGKGYGPDTGPGRGGVGSNYGGGGGYGGSGGGSDDASGRGALGGVIYGVVEEPAHFGSGGGEGLGQAGGAGAGAIRLTVRGTLTVDGAITANGMNGTPYFANGGGGGAGGSVYLTVGTLAGAGQIAANGGDGANAPDSRCGGGGGGRVAVYTSRDEFFGIVSANGGDGHEPGKEGTIHYGTYSPGCGDAFHPYPVGDLNADCKVDLLDVAILCSHWLESTVP